MRAEIKTHIGPGYAVLLTKSFLPRTATLTKVLHVVTDSMSSGSESDDENIFGDDGSGQEIDENILGELEQDLDRDGQPSDQDEVSRGLRLG